LRRLASLPSPGNTEVLNLAALVAKQAKESRTRHFNRSLSCLAFASPADEEELQKWRRLPYKKSGNFDG